MNLDKTHRQCQRLFDTWYPNFRNAGELYSILVGSSVRAHARVLDLGCGRSSLAGSQLALSDNTVGIDLEFLDLKANRVVRYPTLASAEGLPFAEGSFDVVVSQWALEHLQNPGRVFREVARILKVGGSFLVFTTNARNYISILNKLLPLPIHHLLLRLLTGRPPGETFRAYYRANSCAALAALAARSGLTVDTCVYVGNPFYLAFSRVLFVGALLFERLTDLVPLRSLKLYIVARFLKPHQ